jgi:hypothetical protein
MALPIENFNLVEGINLDDSSFSPEEINEAQAIVRQYISDKYQDLDFSELTSLNDLVVRPTAQIFLIFKKLITSFYATNTLSKALALEDDASIKIVDALMSNFTISRKLGNVSTGKIKLVIKGAPTTFSVSKNLAFSTIDGLKFFPQNDFVASQSPSAFDGLKIIPESDKRQSSVIVPVVAEKSGTKYNIEQYTQLTTTTNSFDAISINAFNNFTGGKNDENNKDLIDRLIPALSARNLASPIAIEQTLRERFPAISQISIQAINSPNMTRNSHNIFGIKSGCFCDIYVKTSSFLQEFVAEKVAEKITWTDPNMPELSEYIGKYIIKIDRDDFPGHYRISRITANEQNILSSYLILDEIVKINNNLSDGSQSNYINNIIEGNYSSYIEKYIIFDPVDDPNPSGNCLSVKVYTEGIPEIKEIQEFVNGADAQTALVDTLVRAYIPCLIFVSEIKVKVKAGSIDAEEIQSIVVDYINSIDSKKENIRIDGLISRLKENKAIVSVDTPILISAKISSPDGSVVETFTESTLIIPERRDLGFDRNNICFYCRRSDIPVTLIEV